MRRTKKDGLREMRRDVEAVINALLLQHCAREGEGGGGSRREEYLI